MGGVVIGSVISEYRMYSSKVRAVAVTVNNECNLSCPHCYLQYSGPQSFIDPAICSQLIRAPYEHLALVGKEPLLSRTHATKSMNLIKGARSTGKTTSLISNGFGLKFLTTADLASLSFIDISFDGGAESYKDFRGASFDKLMHIISRLPCSTTDYRALHTLCSSNVSRIDEMVSDIPHEVFSKICFSPYVDTENHGTNHVEAIPILELLQTLARNERFLTDSRAIFLLDEYHLFYNSLSRTQVSDRIFAMGLAEKVCFVPYTPLTLGIVRVTYEGMILPPETGIHPARYKDWSFRIGTNSLSSAYNAFLADEQSVCKRDSADIAA